MKFKNKILASAFLALIIISPTRAADQTFSDVLPENPNHSTLEYLHQEGIFKGYEDGTFQLEKNMNRAELMTVMIREQGLNPEPDVYKNCFPDVTDQWFAAPVCYAKEQGWVQGYDTGLFEPNRLVSREEALKIILRPFFSDEIEALTEDEYAPEEITGTIVVISEWAKPYFSFAYQKNLTAFYSSYPYFNASYKEFIKRGEVADILLKAKLMHKNEWVTFYPFLKDRYLLSMDIKPANLPRCYPMTDNKDTPFIKDYMESRYGALAPEDTGMPYLDDGHVCLESNGNILYSVGAVFEKDAMHQIVRFDRNGNVLAEDSIACDPVGFNFQWLTNFQDGDENYSLGYGEHKNFKFIACNYIKADDKIYFGNHQIEGVDISTFDVFSETYSFDKNHIYNQNLIDEHFYDKNYQALNEHYIKGDRLVYYYLDELYELKAIVLDTDTFEVLEGNYARDAKSVYYGANRLNPQPDLETFEVLEDDLARDKDHVYYGSFTVEGVDMASFEYLEEGRYKDAEREYKYGHPIEENNNAIDTNDNSNIIYYNYY